MSTQEILDNAPKGATHYLINQYAFTEGYFKLTESCDVLVDGKNGWEEIDFDVTMNGNYEVRSLADIARIAELENQWISVEDRLPEDDSFVVAAYHYGFTCDPDAAVCDFYNGGFQLNTDGLDAENHDGVATITMDFKVTHWMPLPKPPKEQG